ncbi:polymorphic toxin-type HINT domain-containing protein [Streptomyces sp. NPDC050149]|uniref:polymorphic toxin-type HINT domain-containing protein n=1 Tax=Streptomyces sp. NPDC050149 TaxID=3365603 RepID=UPI00378EEC32
MSRSFLGFRKHSKRHVNRDRRLRIPLVGAVVLALSIPGVLSPVATAATAGAAVATGAGGLGRPDVPKPRVSPVKSYVASGPNTAVEKWKKSKAVNTRLAANARSERSVSWPKASKSAQKITAEPGSKTVSITTTPPDKKPGKAAKSSASGTATVNLLDQKAARNAGITGVLFTATAQTPGSAEVTVDYKAFGSAIGGNWAGRLGLVMLPGCALTTPQKPECRTQTPVNSHNDLHAQTVAAQVSLPASGAQDAPTPAAAEPGAVFALTALAAASASGTGDYKATPLSASSSWEAGGSSGAFSWSYPIAVPPAAAGPAPSLSLSYNSGSTDGRTANTNNQGSLVGEGFDLTSSYIERRYGSCDDDGQSDKYDLCWKYENASIVLNGKATELVKDDTTGTWRLKDDDASQVFHETGATNGDSGDSVDGTGEYWKVITGDGTTYTFGLNKLPGADTERTNSVFTVPVFGDDAGEPGYSAATSFSGRAKNQAWRWNLDLTTDVHGNAATYWYTKDAKETTNYYAKNGDKTNLAAYTRDGYLTEIRYGQRSDTLFTGDPSGKVVLSYSERCEAADCSSLTEDTADNWPDVPFGSICTETETDCEATGPSFFTRKMLTGIDTFVWSRAAEPDAFKPVDSYALSQDFLDGQEIDNSSDQTLALMSVKRTAKNGTAIPLPAIDFTYQLRANRVWTNSENKPRLYKPRMEKITSETGAITTVTMSEPECVIGSKMPTAEDNNALSCYPVWWAYNGGDPALDWFHKYNVTAVSVTDPRKLNPNVEHSYTYSGPGWHYNDDPFTVEKERTWSAWRGYKTVTSYTGDTYHTQSKTVRLYMQGMHGDKRKDGTTRTATINGIDVPGTTINGTAVPGLDIGNAADSDHFAGELREELTYNGTQPISVKVSGWWSKITATQNRSYANVQAYMVRPSLADNYVYLPVTGKWQQTSATSYFDSYGLKTKTNDRGDTARTDDDTCTRIWYARNDAKGLTNLVSRTRVTGNNCYDSTGATMTDDRLSLPTNSKTRGDVLSDDVVVYDDAGTTTTGWIQSQTPTLGLPTWTGRAKAYPAPIGTADRHPALNGGWQTLTKTTYDTSTAKLGRPLTITDTAGRTVTTAYFPAAAGPLTSTNVTAPKLASNGQQHRIYTYLDPARGSVTYTLDANLKRTDNTYDALGRTTATWLPDRNKSAGDVPSVKYGYNLARGIEPWTSVSTIKSDGETYRTTYSIFDTLLRPLQTQTPAAITGRLLTDTRYDSRGLAYESHADIYDDLSGPNGTYSRTDFAHTPTTTETTFDGAGRPTTSTLHVYGVKKWQTTTSYTGDSTATTALDGGNATRTITDALGRNTETRTYAGTTPADTSYGATTGTAYTRVKTEYTRDGKQNLLTGPDDSQWTYTYDLFGRQVATTDPDKGAATTEYTDLDQVDYTTDANGKVVLYGYDELGRKTDTWQTSRTDTNKLTHWGFDTILKGLPDSSTRYDGGTNGKAYTKKTTAYDALGRATSTDLTLPNDDPLVTSGAITATTTFDTAYYRDGSLNYTAEPAAGGLPAESISPHYDDYGTVQELTGASSYLSDALYSEIGQPLQLVIGTGTKNVYISQDYEAGTGRLIRSNVTDQTHPYMLQELKFTQDQAGNVTSIFDATTQGDTSKADYQCFTYDGYLRLSDAWTPKTADCATTGLTTANLDGAAPYWTSYTYNTAGQRKTETTHANTGNTTTNYNYGTTTGQAHPLSSTTGARTATYNYDASGNTKSRPGTQAAQTLTWNAEGKLTSAIEPAAGTKPALGTTYLYDADGELLIRRATGDGDTVLYLGATEVRLTTKGSAKTVTGTRYYNAAGQTIAMRTATAGTPGSKLTFLAADHHGTSSLAIDATTQALTKRYTTPFGAPRGAPLYGPWPNDKGFLGKTQDDTTNLTHISAREYDPATGQFISVDPLLEPQKPQSLNGYSYAHNSPVTQSDPSGLGVPECHKGVLNHCRNGVPTSESEYNPDRESDSTPADWSVEGETFTDVDNDGSIALLPGVTIPSGWHKQQQFIEAFYRILNGWSYSGLGLYSDHQEVTSIRADIQQALLAACHDTSCPSKATYFRNWAGLNAVGSITEGTGVGRGSRTGNCTQCFLAGTDVLMANGKRKDIEDVQPGDKVMAKDPETGEEGRRAVIRLIRTEDDKHFNELTIATDKGSETLTATHEHPFWSPSEQRWTKAEDLAPGATLLTDTDATVTVTANRAYSQHATTYNLTVDDLHTYYVLAGNTPVLVHNSSCSTFGFKDAPTVPGVYTITMKDGKVYVGSSSTNIHSRLHAAFNSDKAAVKSAGYTTSDISSISVNDMSSHSWKAIRKQEQSVMDQYGGVGGGTLLNRRNEVP